MTKMLLVMLAFFGPLISSQQKPIIHFPPNQARINATYGGKLVQLIDAPTEIALPQIPPKLDSQGNPWAVEIKNLGPRSVNLVSNSSFSTILHVNETVQIDSDGTTYKLKR